MYLQLLIYYVRTTHCDGLLYTFLSKRIIFPQYLRGGVGLVKHMATATARE